MYLNRVFEFSMILDSDKFEEIFAQSYGGDEYMDEDENEYIDQSMASKGITVKYRNSQYKKKIKVMVDAFTITNGAVTDADKLIHKLEKHIDNYFDSSYRLEDFTVSGLTLTTAIDVGSRENVSAYLKVLQRIGKVKGFSPVSFDYLDDDSSFGLKGNSSGIEFMIYDLEQVAASQMGIAESSQKYKGILRVEVRLTKPKAIQKYTTEYGTAEQIIDLSERCQDVFMSVFARVVPFGAFYKKKEAAEIIRSKISDNVLRRRMLKLLVLIPEKKSLLLAQKAMAYRHPDELLVAFAKINLSPVTIAKRQDVRQLKNLYELL